MVSHLKAKNINIIFCCYHVQISLTMSQQTQSDILMQKCYKMHCGVRLHDLNACYVIFWNAVLLLNTGYTWTQGVVTHFIFVYDFIIIGICYWMCSCSRKAYTIENVVDITNLINFIMHGFVDFKYRIWWYHDWIFFNPTNFSL